MRRLSLPLSRAAAHAARVIALATFAQTALATTPASHDVTLTAAAGTTVVEWTGTSPPGTAGGGSTCASTGVSDPTEDGHVINLTVPAGIYTNFKVKADFHIEWDDDAEDLVLTLEKDGAHVDDSDGGSPEENVSINSPTSGSYEAVVCSFAAILPTEFRGKLTITVTEKTVNPDIDGDGVPNDKDVCPGTASGTPVDVDGCPAPGASGLPPRFQIHVSPPGLGDDAGEPSVGFNKFSGNTMFISYVTAIRETYQENVVPPLLPASCPATWEDKSGTLTTVNSLDPILFTDEATGRTWNSQLAGDNSLMEYTDDDGETWTPAQQGPPNGGADHQTVASGVYPAGFQPPTALWPTTGPKRAVYYCSQSVATAFCSRSDDGGQTFGQGNPFKNADCGAGALHGHVKVAPDGTVYVPDSSQCVLGTGGTEQNVVAFRSDNAGVTWTVKNIPSSTGGAGSDPSIGIATDGTLFMCYENSDSHVHMAVSKNKGDTWINDKDLGAAQGIVQTRFPQAIAGDNNRAACAFLGTTTPGNGSSLAFEGVWYGYIATTYDQGLTYHLVNTTPLDPVQGYGGICGSGTCRNLLDFNDLQIDDQGRQLFAFADGCIGGCVKDPSANSFASKATIVRQTGGRTMFAAKDNAPGTRFNNPTTIAPAAACARQDLSTRTIVQADVRWSPPDTGGSRITNYKVYRATDPAGSFALLGSTGTNTFFADTTAKPSVAKYYYRVEAQNAVGIAPVSNTISLEVNTQAVDTCKVPGEIIAQDSDSDASPPADDVEIIYVGVAEPDTDPDNFVITEKVAAFTAGQPPANSFYPILFPLSGKYLSLDATQGAPKFTYGTYQDVGQGVLAFTEQGLLDPDSKYVADGTITMVVPRTFFGSPAPGAVISGFDVRTRVGGQSATSRDTAGPADYTVRGVDICADPGFPIADLSTSDNEGGAPLSVTFKVSGAHTKDKEIVSYSLNFGDGSPVQNGSFGGAGSVNLPHSFGGAGVYRARLTVTDEVGTASSNLAEETITVFGGSSGGTPLDGNTHVGGALAPWSLLVLGLAALAGPRRRRGGR
jgi:hypothetical protein